MAKPLVQLFDTIGLGLIIAGPSGVVWSNQTGGTSCMHPQLEGVFVPLRNDVDSEGRVLPGPALELGAYFTGPAHRGAGAVAGLSERDLALVAEVLGAGGLSTFLEVDRSRAKDSHEAWIHVTVLGEEPVADELKSFRGLGPYPRPGVLTWPNSD